MKPVTRAEREPRDVAYEPIAITSRASAPVKLVGATACGAQFFVAGRWPKPRAGDARKKRPEALNSASDHSVAPQRESPRFLHRSRNGCFDSMAIV